MSENGAESESRRRVALFRGINVGKAKRIAMADLRALFEDLGYGDVRSVLASGNVAFTVPGDEGSIESTAQTGIELAARIGEALEARAGFSARVTVLAAQELTAAARKNPLADVADDPSRLLIAFLADPVHRKRLEPLLDQDWAPEALALPEGAARAAYLWCPDGVLKGRLWEAVEGAAGGAVTSRNRATVEKILALL